MGNKLNIENYIFVINDTNGQRINFKSWGNFAKDWLCFDIQNIPSIGVYSFGEFYIGATHNLKRRIYQHCITAFNNTHRNKRFTSRFNENIFSCVQMPIKILSEKTKDENYFISKHAKSIVNKNTESGKTIIVRIK